MPFAALGLLSTLSSPLARRGYSTPTPVQTQAIPLVLRGLDVFARAQTGTGKTAAFGLPVIHRLMTEPSRSGSKITPRALVLVPTRELALQVNESLQAYGAPVRLRVAAIFGGVNIQPQVNVLRQGVDVVVATPGRLLDHVQQRTLDLSGIEILVLDEADRMLDMGFMPSLRRILAVLPKARQTLLFSATLDREVQELAASFTKSPSHVDVTPANTVATTVTHQVHAVSQERKRALLSHILAEDPSRQTLVFCRTKHGSSRLARQLESTGVRVGVIHGNKSQNARVKALTDFKAGDIDVLVATDVAARGLDIQQLPLVVNYDLPLVAQDYVHRIGRTGRAGMPGRAISLVAEAEAHLLRDIQRLVTVPLARLTMPGFDASAHAPVDPIDERRPPSPRRGSPRGPRGGHATDRAAQPSSRAHARPQARSGASAGAGASPRPERGAGASATARSAGRDAQPRRTQRPASAPGGGARGHRTPRPR